MSLINQMLADLDARSGQRVDGDEVLAGLNVADAPAQERRRRPVLAPAALLVLFGATLLLTKIDFGGREAGHFEPGLMARTQLMPDLVDGRAGVTGQAIPADATSSEKGEPAETKAVATATPSPRKLALSPVAMLALAQIDAHSGDAQRLGPLPRKLAVPEAIALKDRQIEHANAQVSVAEVQAKNTAEPMPGADKAPRAFNLEVARFAAGSRRARPTLVAHAPAAARQAVIAAPASAEPVTAQQPEPVTKLETEPVVAKSSEPARDTTESTIESVNEPAESETGVRFERRPAVAAERPGARHRAALGMIKRGQPQQAEAALQALLDDEPEFVAARLTMASVMLQQRRDADAEQLLRDGLAIHTDDIELALLLARLLVDRDAVTDAVAVLEAAEVQGTARVERDAFLGALYQRLGLHDAARAAYESVVSLDQQRGTAWLGLAISLSELQRADEALQAYRNALDDQALSPRVRDFIALRIRSLEAREG